MRRGGKEQKGKKIYRHSQPYTIIGDSPATGLLTGKQDAGNVRKRDGLKQDASIVTSVAERDILNKSVGKTPQDFETAAPLQEPHFQESPHYPRGLGETWNGPSGCSLRMIS